MAKQYDYDNDDDEYCGIIGGELTSSECAGCDGQEYDFGDLKHVADRLQGEGYEHLGHFRKQQFARDGHNFVLQEPGLPPLEVPNSGVNIAQPQQQNPAMRGDGVGNLLARLLGRGTGGLY